MSLGGGRSAKTRSIQRLWPARAIPLGLALLMLAPLMPLTPAAAQAPLDPWWGPSSRDAPTQGWAVRIPLAVDNPFDYPTPANYPVAVDIDFGKLLVEAGWTNETKFGEARLRGFTLDVDSIRVVEYGRGWSTGPIEGARTEPTPHAFYPAPFEGKRTRDFDPALNPSGTLMFLVQKSMAPAERRYFYVYANPLEYGDTSPTVGLDPAKSVAQRLQARAPLDAYLWGSARGTVFYGFEPQQQGNGHLIHVRPLEPAKPTTITAYQYSLGKFVPIPESVNYRNPRTVPAFFTTDVTFLVPAGTPFKIVADRPVVVSGHGALDGNGGSGESFGFVPSLTGSFAGQSFFAYGFRSNKNDGTGIGPVNVIKATTAASVEVYLSSGGGQRLAATLTNANPIQTFGIPAGQWSFIFATSPILVSSSPISQLNQASPFQGHTVPALSGGPSGIEFATTMVPDGGFLRVCPEATSAIRILDAGNQNLQIYPEGATLSTPPAKVSPSVGCETVRASAATPPNTFQVLSVKDEKVPVPDAPVPVRVLAGADARLNGALTRPFVGQYGGLGGTDYYTDGRTGILGHFNDTRLLIQEETSRDGRTGVVWKNLSVGADGFVQLDPTATPDSTGRYHIVATKPVTVVSTEEATTYGYGRYVGGRPPNLASTTGEAEFRGPLVELRYPDDPLRRSVPVSTGPGNPLDLRLDVVNLGRWIAGESLPDAIAITCTAPEGWRVKGCDQEMTLGSGTSQRLNLQITPSEDSETKSSKPVKIFARSKSSGIGAEFTFNVNVEVRYGVSMWLGEEGGPKRQDPPLGTDPGKAREHRIVIKNTGSNADTFDLSMDPPNPGWTQRLLHRGVEVTSLKLDAGAKDELLFVVTPPDDENPAYKYNYVDVRAVSQRQASAGDVVKPDTRLRPKVSISLELDPQTQVSPPNVTARFNLTVLNSGNDIFRIVFTKEGLLPPGWNASMAVEEIDLGPGEPYTFEVRMTPPAAARAGDLATLKISAETDAGGGQRIPGDEVSAVVVVRKIHDLQVPPLLDAQAEPGETITYVLPITNLGNGPDAIEILPGAITPAWTLVAGNDSLLVGYNESIDLPLRLTVPPATAPNLYNVTFTVRLSRETTQNLSIPVEVKRVARLGFEGAATLATTQGKPTEVPFLARNRGNVEGAYDLAADVPAGWSASFAPARVTLAPGQSQPVTLRLNASRDAADGDHDVTLRARLAGEAAGAQALPTRLAKPQLTVQDVSASGTLRAGELVLVTATIANQGEIDAENVSVALVADGVVVDQVTINRVGVDDAKVATLNWVATGGADDVRVVIDPENLIVMPDREGSAAEVAFGSRLFTPGPTPVLALLAVALLALARRRRGSA